MKYTHYWSFNRHERRKGALDLARTQYAGAIYECQRIVRYYNGAVKNLDPQSPARLSGYTAHTAPGEYGGLKVNGVGSCAHEDFVMREQYDEARDQGGDFCKTAAKPYDEVVTACLIMLAHRLPDLIRVSSDGYAADWERGLALAKAASGISTLQIPAGVRRESSELKLILGGKR